MGIGFCDHNHERKICLAGFEGLLNFAREVHASVMSPVWDLVPRRSQGRGAMEKQWQRLVESAACGGACATCASNCA